MNITLSWLVTAGSTFAIGLFLGRKWRSTSRKSVHQGPTREQLFSWLEQVPSGWLIVDERNEVKFINGRAERFLNISASERYPPMLDRFTGMKPLLDLIETVRWHNKPQKIEWDIGNHELEVFAFAGQEQLVAILMQSRRSLEAQLNQQERWVSDVAHELKTPLTALLLVGDSLAATVNDQNVILVERLLKELRRMQELVQDLLELSRLENVLPGNGINLENINPLHLLKEAWLGVKPLADKKKIKMVLISGGWDTDFCIVAGDRQRLHRALLNLFDNALRYSPDNGEITIDLILNPEWMRIGIKDQGPGLSEEDKEHMFERFYRGDTSRHRKQRGGSGLGLAIVQQIVLAHGGWIFGENHPEGGARFELRLPLKINANR